MICKECKKEIPEGHVCVGREDQLEVTCVNCIQPERSKREDSLIRDMILSCSSDVPEDVKCNEPTEIIAEFGCSLPINFITSKGVKKMEPGKKYDENLNEL